MAVEMEDEIDELSHGVNWGRATATRRNRRGWCRGPNDEEGLTRPNEPERASRRLFESSRVRREPLPLLLQPLIFQPQACATAASSSACSAR